MKFHIQDPKFSNSYDLYQALINGCSEAIVGGGTYAFISAEGVKLFLEHELFEVFMLQGKFTLIVGTDEITNEKSLEALAKVKEKYRNNIDILAFLNENNTSIYHPKYSWFKSQESGKLIIGSGNLTARGLKMNREAFAVIDLPLDKINEIESEWSKWMIENATNLRSIDDVDVIERVKLNRFTKAKKVIQLVKPDNKDDEMQKQIKEIIKINDQEEDVEEEIASWLFNDDSKVLVTEISRNGDRVTQANFSKQVFENFFGAPVWVNGRYHITLKTIKANFTLSPPEITTAVSVASQNWRFELNEMKYGSTERTIGTFVKVGPKMFIYIISTESDYFYSELKDYVKKYGAQKNAKHMCKTIRNIADLQKECPNLPLWNIK